MGKSKVINLSFGYMRFDMMDLIERIRDEQIIWNRKSTTFHSRQQREDAWVRIARFMHKDFVKLSEAEKRELLEALMKRWKNMRDCFLRTNRLKNNDPEVHNYIYERELGFLLTGFAGPSEPLEAATEAPATSNTSDTTTRSRMRKSQRVVQRSSNPAPKRKSNEPVETSPPTRMAVASTKKKRRNFLSSLEKKEKEEDASIRTATTCDFISIDDYDNDKDVGGDDDSNNNNDNGNNENQLLREVDSSKDDTSGIGHNAAERSQFVPELKMQPHTPARSSRKHDLSAKTMRDSPTTPRSHQHSKDDTALPATSSHSCAHLRSTIAPLNLNSDNGNSTMLEYVLPPAICEAADPDQAFFDSIKPMVRTMDVSRKLDFQIEVLKLLKNFRSN